MRQGSTLGVVLLLALAGCSVATGEEPGSLAPAAAPVLPAGALAAVEETVELGFSAPGRIYAVVMADEKLFLRETPGPEGRVVAEIAETSGDLTGSGRHAVIGAERFVEVYGPDDDVRGFIEARFLTERVEPARFCADASVSDLLVELDEALRTGDGERMFGAVSPVHGVTVHFVPGGPGVRYSDREAAALLEGNDPEQDWGHHPHSGEPLHGAFGALVLPDLLDVLGSESTASVCDRLILRPVAYDASWPARYANLNFYSLHEPGTAEVDNLDWRTWVVGVDYAEGQPYVAVLHRFAH